MHSGDAYETEVGGASVKIRDPWRVGVLCVLTFGIYSIVWFYKVNDELDRYGRAQNQPEIQGNPILALAGLLLGFLIVPAIIVWVWTLTRLRRAQDLARTGQELTLGASLALAAFSIVPIVGPLIWHEHVQHNFNVLWLDRDASAAPEPAPVQRRRSGLSVEAQPS